MLSWASLCYHELQLDQDGFTREQTARLPSLKNKDFTRTKSAARGRCTPKPNVFYKCASVGGGGGGGGYGGGGGGNNIRFLFARAEGGQGGPIPASICLLYLYCTCSTVGGRGETERTEPKSTLREMNLNVFSQMMNQNPERSRQSMANLCSVT